VNHNHSNDCKVCNLLDKSDFAISNTKVCETFLLSKNSFFEFDDQKQGKHTHVIETFPSNNQSTVQTTTTTGQMPLYPTGYTTFVDPNTGLTYAYDPNWQYDTNPAYIPM